MSNALVSPLVLFPVYHPTGEPEVGTLVTVKLAGGVTCGARLTRVDSDSYFITIAGLEDPLPYKVGERLVVNRDTIIDWS